MKNLTKNSLEPPDGKEIEVSLFGPGFGEALAVHVGNGKWVLVDSCVLADGQTPAAVAYLEAMGIDPATSVVAVVVSHWHDDHIRGMAETVRACSSADVFISGALNNKELVGLAVALENRSMIETSGIDEFGRVILGLAAGGPLRFGRRLRWVGPDRCIFCDDVMVDGVHVESSLNSLSPCDEMVTRAMLSLSAFLPSYKQPKRRIPCPSPNDGAVALLFRVGSVTVLLGSDVEAGAHGWQAILGTCTTRLGSPSVLKVPHHGGKSGDSEAVWQLCDENVHAILTPWRLGGGVLPTKKDAERICNRTESAYITSKTTSKRLKPKSGLVRGFLERSVEWAKEVNSGHGHIRLRRILGARDGSGWTVQLFGGAVPLSKVAGGN